MQEGNLWEDRPERDNLAASDPERVAELTTKWQAWADRVGVVPREELPGSSYQLTARYRRISEPPKVE